MSDGESEQNGPQAATEQQQPSVVISDGAALALGNVLSRFLTDSRGDVSAKRAKVGTKRPRSTTADRPLVLVDNEEVQKEVDEEREQRKKLKEHRKQKLAFERNGRVVPDAATGAALERELLATATKGAVALFNAITKAQKAAEKARRDAYKEKKKLSKDKDKDKGKAATAGNAVTKQGFMNLMKASIDKPNNAARSGTAGALNDMDKPSDEDDQKPHKEKKKKTAEDDDDDDDDDESSESDSEESGSNRKKKATVAKGPKPKWLKDDYLTSGAKRLRDWDKTGTQSQESSEDSSEDEAANQSSDDDAGKEDEDEEGALDLSESDEESEEESEA